MKKKDREMPRGPLELDRQALCSVDGGNPFAKLFGGGSKPAANTPAASGAPGTPGAGQATTGTTTGTTINPATGQMTNAGSSMSTKDMVKGAAISGGVMAPLFLGPWAIDKMGQSDAPPSGGDPNLKYV
jgi:hypothetical protein